MKGIYLLLIAFCTISIAGCKTGNEPQSVLEKFIQAVGKTDFATAQKFATPESSSMLGLMEMGMKMAPDSTKGKNYDYKQLEYGDTKIEGDKATIAVKNKTTGETTNYTLKKIGTEWKVAFDKASMKPGGNQMNSGFNNGSDSTNKIKGSNQEIEDSSQSYIDSLPLK